MESSHARVLVAGDSRSQRAYFVDLLRAEGLGVREAHDGRVALDLGRIIYPDLLILDFALPRVSGAQVLARLRADRKIRATPVVVLTADEREATGSAVLDAGATDFPSNRWSTWRSMRRKPAAATASAPGNHRATQQPDMTLCCSPTHLGAVSTSRRRAGRPGCRRSFAGRSEHGR